MKNKQRKTGGAFRHAKRLESLAAKKGKDRSKASRPKVKGA